MPRYEHQCIKHKCYFEFEVTYSIHEDPLIKCPKCSSHTKRLISKNVSFETPVDVEWEKTQGLNRKIFRHITGLRK